MTIDEISDKLTSLTGYSTDRYTAEERRVDWNIWLDKVSTMVMESMDEDDYDDPNHGDDPIYTANLVASQQDYSFPTGLAEIKRMEVKLDGSNWYKAEPLDVNQISKATDTTSIANTFHTSKPGYDTQYNSFFLYPIPQTNVTGGVKIWVTRAPEEFSTSDVTTGTKEPGFYRAFHPILAYGPAWEVAQRDRLPNVNELAVMLQDYEQRLRRFYGKRQKDRTSRLDGGYVNYN